MFFLTRFRFVTGKTCKIALDPKTNYFERHEVQSKGLVCMAGKKGHVFKLASMFSEFNSALQDNGHKEHEEVTCVPQAPVKPGCMQADQTDTGEWVKYLHMGYCILILLEDSAFRRVSKESFQKKSGGFVLYFQNYKHNCERFF